MSEQIVSPFAGNAQSTLRFIPGTDIPLESVPHTIHCVSPHSLTLSVEGLAVEKVNSIEWTGDYIKPETVTRASLWNTNRRRKATCIARRWVCWVVYHHPLTNQMSLRDIANRFSVDHKAVSYACRCVDKLFLRDRFSMEAYALRDVCHSLNEVFPYFDPDKVAKQ